MKINLNAYTRTKHKFELTLTSDLDSFERILKDMLRLITKSLTFLISQNETR